MPITSYDTSKLDRALTTCGSKHTAGYENTRNSVFGQLYEDMIKEALGVPEVICAHHLVYVLEEHCKGTQYTGAQEIPSADTLIFDHEIARKLWPTSWQAVLTELALTPIEQRDQKLSALYYSRAKPANGN